MNDSTLYLILSIAVMAVVTYLIRMLPLAVFRKRIQSKFVLNFLYYVPFAVLSAMTIPAVFTSCGGSFSGVICSLVGFVVALILAIFERGLLTVAVSACAAAFLTDIIIGLFGI